MEELFNGQLSFADIDAEKFLHVRRAHADRRVNAMDRLTDDVINELIQLCLPHYHIKAGETVQQGRPYTRLETMVRVHLLQVSLNLSDPEMESYLASDMVARNFCRVSSTRLFISDSRYCASGISSKNTVWRRNSLAHGESGRRGRSLFF